LERNVTFNLDTYINLKPAIKCIEAWLKLNGTTLSSSSVL